MPPLSELILAAQSGDEAAVEALVARYSGPIRQECYKIGLSNHVDLSQSDLMQEVLMHVWKNILQFRGGENEEHTERAFGLWLRKNARTALSNVCRNRAAQKRNPKEGMQTFEDATANYGDYRPAQSSPSSIFFKGEAADQLRHAMDNELDEQTRHIVLSHIVDGQSFKEIGLELQLSYDQVRYAFHTAQTKLARWLT